MQVDHVITDISQKASGPSLSVPRLCESLVSQGVDVRLHVLSSSNESDSVNVPLFQHKRWTWCPRLAASPQLYRALCASAQRAELIHNHSLWEMTNVYPGRAIRGTQCRLINSPRGTLLDGALQRSPLRKRIMWSCGQANAVKASACLHATSEEEAFSLKKLGFRIPIAMIPNGIDIPDTSNASSEKTRERRTLLFLGRIHPIKRIDILLRAWSQIETIFPEWDLIVAGPDNNGYLPKMCQLARHLQLRRVSFPGPVFGEDKLRMLKEASLFVLPSKSENFAMSVAEALAVGVPAIVTKGAPWEKLDSEGCGWWIEHGEDHLVECLRHALSSSPAALHEAGLRGRSWMKREFDWNRIAQMMLETYVWVLGGGSPPGCIQHVS